MPTWRTLAWRPAQHPRAPPPLFASRPHPAADSDDAWLTAASEDAPLEGNALSAAPDYSSTTAAPGSARSGFKWRGGLERMTTGMWLWSRPFVRRLPEASGGGEVAVLLMDTQGLFDSETGQMLTTCIFGLSALMSSYLIFNVSRQVQEDHLQHLALFTEYGRRVTEAQEARAASKGREPPQRAGGAGKPQAGGSRSSSAAGGRPTERGSEEGEESDEGAPAEDDKDDGGVGATAAVAALRRLAAWGSGVSGGGSGVGSGGGGGGGSDGSSPAARPAPPAPPFQCLEFLVRDAVLRSPGDPAACERAMEEHLAGVLGKSHNRDLVTVRQHIRSCFADVSAFALPHPGFAVAESEQYAGAVGDIRLEFARLVAYYARRVFAVRLRAKLVHGRAVDAAELGRLFAAYALAFQERAGFPEAKLLLEATAEAHNTGARESAARAYDDAMEAFFRRGYAPNAALAARAARARAAALRLFDSLANFGAEAAIADARSQLEAHISARRRELLTRNTERDPTRVIGPLLLAAGVALGAWVAKLLIDLTCAPWLDVCRRGSQMFAFIYSAILVALGALAYWHRNALGAQRGALAPIGDRLTELLASGLRAAMGGGMQPMAHAPGGGRRATRTAGAAQEDIDEGKGERAAPEGSRREEEPLAEPTEGLAAAAGVRRRRSQRV